MDLVVEVDSIRGKCPVYSKGDRFLIRDGYWVDTSQSSAICLHALSAMLTFISSLSRGTSPSELGLSKGGFPAYVQCPDPGEPFTAGGTVRFKIERGLEDAGQ